MALSCIIVDDEPLAVKLLESFVSKTPDLHLLGSFTDSVEAINAVKEHRPNLLFLDIQMPDLNGMELAHMIPEGTKVIFTTAFKEYAFESYEVRALDFLLKPIRYNKFLAAIDKAKEWFGNHGDKPLDSAIGSNPGPVPLISSNTTIFLKVDGEYRQIAISDIIYVSGMKDYVMFYLDNERRPLVTPYNSSCAYIVLSSSASTRSARWTVTTASISATRSSTSQRPISPPSNSISPLNSQVNRKSL